MTHSQDSVAALNRAFVHARAHIEGLGSAPVGATVGADELRARLGGALPEHGSPPVEVVDALVAATAGGHLGSAGGRFFAWVIGGSLSSALAADWLTSTWDQNAALHACGPAAAVVEEVAGRWLIDLLGLPDEASFAFTTGCQLAHFTCLAAAREAVLRTAGWDVNRDGLFDAPRIRVIVSELRHASVDRALRFLGFGQKSLTVLPTAADGAVDRAAFHSALGGGPGPTIVVLDAADLSVGAFDAFEELIPSAKRSGAWVHVDGAFGLIARASRSMRHLLTGVELADSWATDAHKWLNVPFDSGFAAIRDRAAHRASMTVNASYITPGESVRDQIDWNPEWSRRARGFAVYAALRELGRTGIEDLVDRSCLHARDLVSGIGGLPGAQVLWPPTLNQGLIRFLDPRPGASEEDHDRWTDGVIREINETGEAFFSGTAWRGRRAMRVSVINWRTTAGDVARAVEAARRVLRRAA
ncbi:pyridoxal phosphate-dependent decarboxylase family protein [Corallococcus carmarthensis]|uniref:Aspartate aminotransferase family protein n=1 Tax=Corallococcus carmarthensis TaxID=2316728 RepID=A0A3A8JYB5_9BACT|nr:pyridoxal-dependent decarboxylase [Corallococcus carmarthensis]NOK19266.1 aspartate aminotransferase family protein [Corallococcus carmarthensis]RKH00730.1 aspartate aminotransferase family protein [Corallococcus carmarthensis]